MMSINFVCQNTEFVEKDQAVLRCLGVWKVFLGPYFQNFLEFFGMFLITRCSQK